MGCLGFLKDGRHFVVFKKDGDFFQELDLLESCTCFSFFLNFVYIYICIYFIFLFIILYNYDACFIDFMNIHLHICPVLQI